MRNGKPHRLFRVGLQYGSNVLHPFRVCDGSHRILADAPIFPIVPVVISALSTLTTEKSSPNTMQKIIPRFSTKCLTNLIPNQLTKTRLEAHVFAHFLSEHTDHNYANEVINILLHGAHLGHCGPRVARSSPNSFSVKKHKKLIADTIAAEVTAGHTCGPFEYQYSLI